MLALDPHVWGVRKSLVFGTGGLVKSGLDRPERQTLARPFLQSHINSMKALTIKQRAFAPEFVKDESPRQAAIRAGYSPKAASQQAGKLLSDQRIQERIAKLRSAEASPDDMTLAEHWRALTKLRGELEDAFKLPDVTSAQVSALRGAVDAEIARGRALRFHDPDPRPPKEDDDAPTMGEVLRDVLRPDSRKPVEPQTNGSGEGG